MNADADRNLLFGLLALQTGLVDQDQLVAAFRVWSRDRASPIADLLADRGDLDGEQRDLVNGLVAQHVKKHGGSVERSLAAMDLNAIRQELTQVDAPLVEAMLGHIPAQPTTGKAGADPTASYSVGSATSDGQRFRLLRPHARGGLGAVFVAMDTELHREVALKQILDSHADNLFSRARFLLEAEITGGLEHPGIVPVYGLGTYDGGRPYYAMRFIKGQSLKQAIEQFHDSASTRDDSGRRSLELRKLLRCFNDVCNTVEYAHSRGVLHRDIKPANVIVGRHGETLLVDWGLAKALGKADPQSGERTLVPHSGSGSAETMPGSALGTPAYMSPEQAEGDLEQLGPRSDVYSLGATLYCLLTGVSPFTGDAADVIPAVQRGAFHPPRQHDPHIDPALDAVCLKAMALRPCDRYATPRALAEDLERWAADEPVSAWREPIGRRTRRWARRHRTAMTAGAVAFLALLFGTMTVLAVQTSANGRLQTANAELAAAKERETARFNLALEAIKLFHGQVGDDLVLKQDQFRPMRNKLLLGAAGFYGQLEGLLKNQPDRTSRAALGRAYAELGKLTSMIGGAVEAIAVYRKALAVRRALASAPGSDAELTADLARTLHAIAIELQESGDTGEALTAYKEAVALLEALPPGHTSADAWQLLLGQVQLDLAELLNEMGKFDDAMAAMDRSLAVLTRLVENHPQAAQYRSSLAGSELSRGYFLTRIGRPGEALEAQRRARTIFQKLVDDNPGVLDYRRELRRCDINIGFTLEHLKRPEEAQVSYRLALATAQKLSDENPAVMTFRLEAAELNFQIGRTYADLTKPAEALEYYNRAMSGYQKLLDDDPSVANHRNAVGVCHEFIGQMMQSIGRTAEAEQSYRRAIDVLQKLVEDSPAVTMYRDDLAANHLYLGELFAPSGRISEAETEFRAAVAGYQKLFDGTPEDLTARTYLARSLHGLGGLLRVTGRRTEAMELFRRVLELRERLARDDRSDSQRQSQLAETLNEMALCEMRPGHWTEAREFLTRAVELERKVLSSAPDDPAIRQILRRHLTNLAKVHRELAQPEEAIRTARELAELSPGNPAALYQAACELSLTVPLLKGASQQALATQAVETLRQAVAAGWRDAGRTSRDPAFFPLHDRDDFRRLLDNLFDQGFPDDAFAPRR